MFGLDSPEVSEEEKKIVSVQKVSEPSAAPRSMSAGEEDDQEDDDFW